MSLFKRVFSNDVYQGLKNASSPSASNPFATISDLTGFNISSVNTYSDLPAASTVPNQYYRTLNSQGTRWFPGVLGGTYYAKGIYQSVGGVWDYVGEFPYQASQSEVDAGSVNDTFVTPNTFSNAAKWGTKANVSHTHTASDITDFDTGVSNNPTVQALQADSHTHSNQSILDQITADDYNILTNSVSTGLITGGHITINALDNTKFDISAGSGVIVNNTNYPPVKTFVSWATMTGNSTPFLTTDTNTFIAIDSTGSLVLTNALQDYFLTSSVIILGWVEHTNNTFIERFLDEPYYVPDLQQQFNQFLEALKAFNIQGNEVTANGANLKLDISSGLIFDNGTGYSVDQHAVNIFPTPLITSVPIKYFYRDGAGDWVNDLTNVTDVNPNVYDNGSGTLQAVPAGNWIVQRAYYYGPFGYLDVYHSQNTYSTKEEALNAIIIESFEENPYLSYDIPVAVIIVQQGATDLTNSLTSEIRKLNKSSLGGFSNNIGEANTASNIGTTGVGVYKSKTGVTLEFKKLANGGSVLTIAENVLNDTIEFNINQATSSSDGYLSSTDWNTFNNKQDNLGYTPEDISNKQNNLASSSVKYPTVDAVNSGLATKEPSIAPGTTNQYYRGDKTFQTLDKNAVGLGNVDNTSDANKPVSTAQSTAIGLKEDSTNKHTTAITGNETNNVKFPTIKQIVDWATALFVPSSRTITINGNTQDLSANRSFTVTATGTANLSTTQTATDVTINSDAGTDATIPLGNGTSAGVSSNDYTTAEKSKLAGIASGATANSSDATLLNRSSHTGTQLASTISDLTEAVQDVVGATLTSGSANVSISYNDVAGTITITVTDSDVAAGSDTQVQYNNAGLTAGATNVLIHGNDLTLANNSTPTTPNTDTLKFFGKRFGQTGSRMIPAVIDPSGMDYTLQPSIWRQKIATWNPSGNSATVPGINGLPAPTALGTATARSVATTNNLTRSKRLGYVSAATAAAMCGHYITAAQYTLGNGSNVGGFFYSCRFGISDATLQTVANGFVGMSSSVAAATNVDPATLTNSIGVGYTSGDTNYFLYYGGSSAQTRINLGATMPINTSNFMDFTLWSPPNQNGVLYYRLEIVGPGTVVEGLLGPGTAGVTLPANTTLLSHRAWRSNNTAALAVGLDIGGVYFETDW